MAKFAPARPHGEIREVFPEIFMVTGTMQFFPGFSIPRNMTIVRQGDELTILNSVRLDARGEAALEKLGKVKHLVRLSGFHGLDDPYFRDRYAPTYWAPPGLEHDRALGDSESPVGKALLLQAAKGTEAVVVLPGGVLQTCDSFQNWLEGDIAACSWLGGIFMRRAGFGPALVGPFWLKQLGPAIERDLRAVAELDFQHNLCGHGSPLRDTAAEQYRSALARAFAGPA